MIDIHNHILYGLDDGSKTLEESCELLDSAIKAGVKAICFTPHFIPESRFMASISEKERKFLILKEKYAGKIDLYLGNEIYMNNDILELLKDKIEPLAKSKYLLIELPVCNEYPSLENILFQLQTAGYKVIIAHPERYLYFKNNISKIFRLMEQGIYFQGNYMSLFDTYGKSTKEQFIRLLKHRVYSFLASDIHHKDDNYYLKLKQGKEKIKHMTSKEYMEKLMETNPNKVIKNEKIEHEIPVKITFFERIRGKI